MRYFRIPIILISSVASVSSVGLQPYLDQQTISVITCLLSLTCGIIGSIELFLAIQSSMENELMASKDYYILSIEIFKVLTLDRENRSMDGKSFLETSYGTYVKLIENSNILDEKIADRLTLVVDKNIDKYVDKYIDSSSDESPVSQSSAKNKLSFLSTTASYWCTKKKDKKINIEKTQSIDELVGHSLKKNNILNLDHTNIHRLQIHPPPIHQPLTQSQMRPPSPQPTQMQPPSPQPTQMQPPSPQPPLQIQASKSFSYNNLFSNNIPDPFFYNNFIKLTNFEQFTQLPSNNNLSNNSSNININNINDDINTTINDDINTTINNDINNTNGDINTTINNDINNINDDINNINDDIIGISEQNLIEYT